MANRISPGGLKLSIAARGYACISLLLAVLTPCHVCILRYYNKASRLIHLFTITYQLKVKKGLISYRLSDPTLQRSLPASTTNAALHSV